MQNKKGMTIVEIIVSIVLISIVLVFLMQLFLNLRGVTYQSQIDIDYEILAANIIKAVGKDIENYTVYKLERLDEKSVRIIFNEYRPTELAERITKILKIYEIDGKVFISYSYDSENLTSQERSDSIIRELPKNSILDDATQIKLNPSQDIFETNEEIFEIKIPISTDKSVIYDINIYGVIVR